jgi:hypothetical protein
LPRQNFLRLMKMNQIHHPVADHPVAGVETVVEAEALLAQ